MKKLLIVFLLANVTFFALMQSGWLDRSEQAKPEQPSLNEEQIRLLDNSSLDRAKKSKSESDKILDLPVSTQISASSAPNADPKLSMSMSVQATSEKDIPICLEWGDFSGTDLARVTSALLTLQLGDKLGEREIEQDTGYWIYIPPLKNKSAVNKKIDELKKLGIKEYFVVLNPERWQNAISLGVFKTREAAQNLLNQIRSKGVSSAQIGERASKLKMTRFVLGGVGSETRARLIEIQKDFPGSELEKIPCALTRQDEIGRMPRSSR